MRMGLSETVFCMMKVQLNILKGRHSGLRSNRAFTLIELLAVALVILILAALALPLVGYIQRRVAYQTARAQIAALSAALESYKSDWGFYPATTPVRISNLGIAESSNNWYMYRAQWAHGAAGAIKLT